ncbi:unnamed protein product [Brugia timori]|uniref:Uncharacterized protein n=1 Tax=Brugia timori TaxID=42155 RepID=A0A3P7WGA5_9BILA|nr:unnamed protein product [Brugia timori]
MVLKYKKKLARKGHDEKFIPRKDFLPKTINWSGINLVIYSSTYFC